jgi:hypothetical protein
LKVKVHLRGLGIEGGYFYLKEKGPEIVDCIYLNQLRVQLWVVVW